MLEEEVASVKDFITFGLPTQGHEESVETSGSGRRPIILEFKFGKGYMAEDDGTKDVMKTAFVPQQIEQKKKLSMDPMVESSWKSKDYLATAKESISLVGKSTRMLDVTSGGFVPQVAGVRPMKLEGPP